MKVTLRRYKMKYQRVSEITVPVSLLSTGSSQDWNPLKNMTERYDGYGNSIQSYGQSRTMSRDCWVW